MRSSKFAICARRKAKETRLRGVAGTGPAIDDFGSLGASYSLGGSSNFTFA